MTATTVGRTTSGPTTPAGSGLSVQALARLTGALYVVLAVLGMMGPLTLESLLVAGDADATAAEVTGSMGLFTMSIGAWIVIVAVDVAITGTLYQLLAPVDRLLSLVAAAFRLTYSIVMAALLVLLFQARDELTPAADADAAAKEQALSALETFSDGFLVALVFFGLHLVLLGALFLMSRYIPRVIGALLVAAGIGYVVDSLASLTVESYGGALSGVLLTPAVLGEVGLALWLLVKGVRLTR